MAFTAANHEQVNEFHAGALANGGKDNVPSGIREHCHPSYYAAYVLDPDGNNIEAVSQNRKCVIEVSTWSVALPVHLLLFRQGGQIQAIKRLD